MSITRKIKGALAAVLCMGMLAGCASTTTSSAPESAPQSAADSSAAEISPAEPGIVAPLGPNPLPPKRPLPL